MNIRRLIKIQVKAIGLLLVLLSFSSCHYLDVDKYFDNTLTLDTAFTKRTYVEGFLSNAFEVMYVDVSDICSGGARPDYTGGYALFASDDLLKMDDNTKRYQNGEYSASETLYEDKWKRVFEPVRKATTFINYVDKCEEMTLAERSDLKAQARFLRAYAYWVLLRQYGPIPLIPESGFDISMSYSQLSVQRNTFDECVEFIAKDFLLAAQNLPLTRTSNNIGRPTKGAALAARARLFLYAASPLYNGNSDMSELKNDEGQQLIPQVYDESKWARAAAAALDVINLKQYKILTVGKIDQTVVPPFNTEYSDKNFPEGWADIDPFESYRQMFNGAVSASKNPELIFTRPNDKDYGISDLVKLSMPYTVKGQNAIAVTLKQVNAYCMKDGKSIYEAKATGDYVEDGFTTSATQYDFLSRGVSLQYANREPRFYASIAYPGSIWECSSASETTLKNIQVFYYKDQLDGKQYSNVGNYPVTGIGMKKYYNPEDALSLGGYLVEKYEPAIRYADVLMWYAEALNELTTTHKVALINGDEVEIKRDVEEMRKGIKPIRMRAGLPDFADNIYSDQSGFRTALKHERQIEFFGESKRYYDLRRWKDAQVEENIPIKGYNIEMNQTNSQKQQFYRETLVNTFPKIFISPNMYMWPIPQYELERNKKLTQNPGW